MKKIFTGFPLIMISGCTYLKVSEAEGINDEICVIENTNVKRAFNRAYLRQITNNGYKAKLVSDKDATDCTFTSTYTASYGIQ